LLAIVFSFCFFRSANFKEFLFSFSFLPVIFFFVKKPKATKSVVFEPIAEEEAVKDPQLRQFLRVVGVTGVGLFLLSLLNPKKVGAAFFGSVPGPGTVALKDTSDTKINPATSDKQQPPSTTPTVYNVTLTNADTEYSQTLPANTREFRFRCRTSYDIRYALESGKVATPTAPYLTLPAGSDYYSDWNNLSSKTLYFASSTAGVVVEVEVWTA